MNKLLLIVTLSWMLASPAAIAFEIPYGVQDPFKSPGFPACKGGETGYWNVIKRTVQEREVIFLLLTRVDLADPAYAICWQPGEHRIMAMGPEQAL